MGQKETRTHIYNSREILTVAEAQLNLYKIFSISSFLLNQTFEYSFPFCELLNKHMKLVPPYLVVRGTALLYIPTFRYDL